MTPEALERLEASLARIEEALTRIEGLLVKIGFGLGVRPNG